MNGQFYQQGLLFDFVLESALDHFRLVSLNDPPDDAQVYLKAFPLLATHWYWQSIF
jgi:hypothetical protein